MCFLYFFFFKQKTAYEMRISDWSSDVCSSDLALRRPAQLIGLRHRAEVGHQASGHRGGYRHRCGRPVRIQPEQVPTGGGCPDRAEDDRRLKGLRGVLVAVAGCQRGPRPEVGGLCREETTASRKWLTHEQTN